MSLHVLRRCLYRCRSARIRADHWEASSSRVCSFIAEGLQPQKDRRGRGILRLFEHDLRAVFNAVRYMARSGCSWRLIPNDLPPWAAVHQQFRRWLDAGVFEALVANVQSIVREWAERRGRSPTAQYTARSGQAPHGQTRLRAPAQTVGRRTQLRMGRTLQTPSQRLRTPANYPQRHTLHRIRHPHDKQTCQTRNFITCSRAY